MQISEVIISISGMLGTILMALMKDLIAIKNKKNENKQRITEDEIQRKNKIDEELHDIIFKMIEQHINSFDKLTEILSSKYELHSDFMNDILKTIFINKTSRFDFLSEMYYPNVATMYKEVADSSVRLIKEIIDKKNEQESFVLNEIQVIYAEYNKIGQQLENLKYFFIKKCRENRFEFLKKNTNLINIDEQEL